MNRKGQTTVEYVLVAVLVILGIIFAFRSARIDQAIGGAAQHVQNGMLVDE